MQIAPPLPASYWTALALSILTGMLCRRWPLLSLHGAVAALCAVGQALVLRLPADPAVLLADSILFVLPSIVLVHACGMSEKLSISVYAIVPFAVVVGETFGSEMRGLLSTIGIGSIQGFAAVFGTNREIRSERKSVERWVAVTLSAVGILGLGFSEIWTDVAWTAAAAHAFACVAYLVDEQG